MKSTIRNGLKLQLGCGAKLEQYLLLLDSVVNKHFEKTHLPKRLKNITALTAPFLNHMITQIDLRFPDQNLEIIKGFVIVPENIVNRKADSELLPWKEEFKQFLKIYEDDLSPFNNTETEMNMWELYWKTQHQENLAAPKKLSAILKEIRHMKVTFPTIFTALQLLVTIPVTTCECERSNSVLKRLQTYLRSTIGEERLNGLALMNMRQLYLSKF